MYLILTDKEIKLNVNENYYSFEISNTLFIFKYPNVKLLKFYRNLVYWEFRLIRNYLFKDKWVYS